MVAVIALSVSAVAVTSGGAARGGGGTACAFDPATGLLTVAFTSATGTPQFPDLLQPRIARDGEEITVRGGLGPPLACAGGVPTVRNTDRIELSETGEVRVLLDLDLSDGPLAPGATPEAPGAPEIEVDSFLSSVNIAITPSERPERYSFGSSATGLGANLNANERADDVDLLLHGLTGVRKRDFVFEVATFSGRQGSNRGDDRYSAAGGSATGRPFPHSVLFVGGRGIDRLTGGDGNDTLYGGEGRDRLAAGRGDDRINTLGAQRDRVDCGPGRDQAESSRNDELERCERVFREGPVPR